MERSEPDTCFLFEKIINFYKFVIKITNKFFNKIILLEIVIRYYYSGLNNNPPFDSCF